MIRELQINEIEEFNSLDHNFDGLKVTEEKLENDPFLKVIIYILDNKIVGFLSASFIYERAEINYLFVQKEYRLKKIASSLIKYFIKMAAINNIEDITLEVNKDNIAALNLYRKFGFEDIAIREKYYKDTDGILMLKKVGD